MVITVLNIGQTFNVWLLVVLESRNSMVQFEDLQRHWGASLYKDLGMDVKLKVMLDANAAKGIAERRGLCTVRHIDTDTLWLQEAQARKPCPGKKVLGTSNPADMMIKHLPETDLAKNLAKLNIQWSNGRARAAAHICHLHDRAVRDHPGWGDSWDCRGKSGTWRRKHCAWRRALFAPPPGTPTTMLLMNGRVTEGAKAECTHLKIVQLEVAYSYQERTTFSMDSGYYILYCWI